MTVKETGKKCLLLVNQKDKAYELTVEGHWKESMQVNGRRGETTDAWIHAVNNQRGKEWVTPSHGPRPLRCVVIMIILHTAKETDCKRGEQLRCCFRQEKGRFGVWGRRWRSLR